MPLRDFVHYVVVPTNKLIGSLCRHYCFSQADRKKSLPGSDIIFLNLLKSTKLDQNVCKQLHTSTASFPDFSFKNHSTPFPSPAPVSTENDDDTTHSECRLPSPPFQDSRRLSASLPCNIPSPLPHPTPQPTKPRETKNPIPSERHPRTPETYPVRSK